MKLINVYVATRDVEYFGGVVVSNVHNVFTCPVEAEQWRTDTDANENATRYIDVFAIQIPE